MPNDRDLSHGELTWIRDSFADDPEAGGAVDTDDLIRWAGMLGRAASMLTTRDQRIAELEAERDHYHALGDDLDRLATENIGLAGTVRLTEQERDSLAARVAELGTRLAAAEERLRAAVGALNIARPVVRMAAAEAGRRIPVPDAEAALGAIDTALAQLKEGDGGE